MKRFPVLACLAAAAVLAGCGNDDPATSPAPSATTHRDTGVGDEIVFSRADNSTRIGSVRILEAVTVPAECAVDSPPAGQTIGLRMEIVNDGALKLSSPSLGMGVNDAQGYTQDAAVVNIAGPCKQQYQPLASSVAPGKTMGWILVQPRQPNPAAVIYTPLVGAENSTLENLQFVETAPKFATIRLPALTAPAAPPPMTTAPSPRPSPEPLPTTQAPIKRAPMVGGACDPDVDNYSNTADGQLVKCAYAGAPTPRWVMSAPIVGTRAQGSPCTAGTSGIAISPDGRDMVCVGDAGEATWQPGP